MNIRSPYDQLAGCTWLARIVDKIRRDQEGTLGTEYQEYLCNPAATDGLFLYFFDLDADELVDNVCKHSTDEDLEIWFLGLHGVTPETISQWNDFAVSFGSNGPRSRLKFEEVLDTIYSGCDDPEVHTFYDLIDWDEGRFPNPKKGQYFT